MRLPAYHESLILFVRPFEVGDSLRFVGVINQMKDPQTKMSVAARHTPSFQSSRDPIPVTYALLNVRGGLNYLVKSMCSRTVAEDGWWAFQQFFKGRDASLSHNFRE